MRLFNGQGELCSNSTLQTIYNVISIRFKKWPLYVFLMVISFFMYIMQAI